MKNRMRPLPFVVVIGLLIGGALASHVLFTRPALAQSLPAEERITDPNLRLLAREIADCRKRVTELDAADLTSRVARLENMLTALAARIDALERSVAADTTKTGAATAVPSPPPSEGAAGSGFTFKNLNMTQISQDSKSSSAKIEIIVTGLLRNGSGKSYSSTVFNLTLYGRDGRILDTQTIKMQEFDEGSEKPFKHDIKQSKFPLAEIVKHTLTFDSSASKEKPRRNAWP